MSDEADRIDQQRLGSSVEAEVLRYDDNDILVHDSAQVESGYGNAQGSIVLSWNQAHEFTKIVQEESASEWADEPHVQNVTVGTEWTLGKDQSGDVATFERNMDPEFYFTLDDGECLLTHDQAQDLYEYLVRVGYDDMWGVEA